MSIQKLMEGPVKAPYQGLVAYCIAAYPAKQAGAYRRLNFYVKDESTAGEQKGTRCSWLNPPDTVTERLLAQKALVLTGTVAEWEGKKYLEVTQVMEYAGPELSWVGAAKAQGGRGGGGGGGGGWKGRPLPKFDPIEASAQIAWAADAFGVLMAKGIPPEAAAATVDTVLMKFSGEG